MYALKTITFDLPDLGSNVQLRELTADQFFDVNTEVAESRTDRRVGQYLWLSKMLWVDGQQFSADEIAQWGASVTIPLLTRMNELFPKMYMDDEESEEGEAVEQDPNG